MSGSYDDNSRGGPPGPRNVNPNLQDAYDDVVTGPAPTTHRPTATTTLNPGPTARPALQAGGRGSRNDMIDSHGPVVPAGSVTGNSLTLVIAIMSFLACLTAGAVYMINQSADAWLRDIANEVTVQVAPRENAEKSEQTVDEVVGFLKQQPGIASARPLTASESGELLEPWLGNSEALATLPVPRLIAVEIDRTAPPELKALGKRISDKFNGAVLDDHRHWQQQIRTVTRSFALGGIGILILVCAATTAIIVSATRSAMASNREIVEVLHFVGATDGFISREFEKHFLRLGIKAGIIGAGLAMLVFFLMPAVMQFLGGGQVTMTELNRLVGTGYLDLAGYVLLGIFVIVTAALCMLTSRFGVYRILNEKW